MDDSDLPRTSRVPHLPSRLSVLITTSCRGRQLAGNRESSGNLK